VDVRGRVEGHIEKWLFHPGPEVSDGQPLNVLDVRPLRAQVQWALEMLYQTEADLTFALRQVSLRQAHANQADSQSTLVKAQQNYDLLMTLLAQSRADMQALDAAVSTLQDIARWKLNCSPSKAR
jgi:membrane fusion protein, multidrug efflux system